MPGPDQDITVTVQAQAHEGLDSLTLLYSVNEEDWQSIAMTAQDEHFVGIIPQQSNRAVVQFYVEGKDISGAVSWYPAEGPQSGAFVRVDSVASSSQRQVMRLIMRASDSTAMLRGPDILDNSRRDVTLIMNEEEVTYNCGIRLRGSMFSRSGAAGHNIKLPADQRFRGTQPTVIIRQRNPQEILVKHMANQASNGVPASYNDLVELRGYRNSQNGLTRMEMARFGENFLSGAFEDGASQPMFKMEGIRDFQQTGSNGAKLPMPIGWIVQFDFADLGDDREQYRHVIRMISARKQDNYAPVIAMCQAFSAPDEELREAVEKVIDVNQWARMMAMQTLCGIADVYPIENPHNFNIYTRPSDGRMIALPWDWDFTFNLAANSRIIDPRSSRKNLWRVLSEPGINRLYRGHLLDLTDTVFNEAYADRWFNHYGEVAGTSYRSQINYVRSRSAAVRSQAGSVTPFRITTEDGNGFTTDGNQVTLEGSGGVRILTLEHEETGISYQPEWLDDETWNLTLPLTEEVTTFTLQARDYQGSKGTLFSPLGRDSITVTSTATTSAPSANTIVTSEIMYHPSDPSDAEVAAGFTDADQFEYLVVRNTGDRALDLTSLRLSAGVQF